MNLLKTIPIGEILRYMGCPPDRADPVSQAAAERAAQRILAAAVPRWTWMETSLSPEEDGIRLSSGLLLPGQDLKRHLAGCGSAVLFCATLGAGVDALLRRAASGDLLEALALDCAASAAVEEVCDAIEVALRERWPAKYFPFRYSPGYGDLPLSLQGELLRLLDAPRRVGLTASSSHILLPRKSVTAILGLSDTPVAASSRSCATCPGRDGCLYRKSGGHCGIS